MATEIFATVSVLEFERPFKYEKVVAALEYMKVRTQSDLKIAGSDDRWVRRTDLIVPVRGNTAAVSDLDMVYLEDRVVRKTDPEAIKWLLRAAYHGNPEAQYDLSMVYKNGRGVRKSYTQYMKWLRRAAYHGNANAQCELGEKVDNPNAVSLPLKLAVALLKDSSGKIKIDVPITGSLDNPKFNIGSLVADALINVISKVITSPFRALGSLIGSEKDMSTISFAAGDSSLNKQQQDKLDSLSKALKERPILNLDIKGAAFQEQDWPVLREGALYDQLKKRRATEINKSADKKIRDEYVEISDDDYKRLLAEMFIEKFPLLAEKSILGTPQLRDSKAGDFYEIAKQKLFTIIKAEQGRLKKLALARARAIANYVVQKGGVPNQRVFILDTVIDPERENKDISSSLSLNTN